MKPLAMQAVTRNGRTALHEAAEAGNNEIVQALLSIGARAEMQDKVGTDHS